jgi:hypothetical protein
MGAEENSGLAGRKVDPTARRRSIGILPNDGDESLVTVTKWDVLTCLSSSDDLLMTSRRPKNWNAVGLR